MKRIEELKEENVQLDAKITRFSSDLDQAELTNRLRNLLTEHILLRQQISEYNAKGSGDMPPSQEDDSSDDIRDRSCDHQDSCGDSMQLCDDQVEVDESCDQREQASDNQMESCEQQEISCDLSCDQREQASDNQMESCEQQELESNIEQNELSHDNGMESCDHQEISCDLSCDHQEKCDQSGDEDLGRTSPSVVMDIPTTFPRNQSTVSDQSSPRTNPVDTYQRSNSPFRTHPSEKSNPPPQPFPVSSLLPAPGMDGLEHIAGSCHSPMTGHTNPLPPPSTSTVSQHQNGKGIEQQKEHSLNSWQYQNAVPMTNVNPRLPNPQVTGPQASVLQASMPQASISQVSMSQTHARGPQAGMPQSNGPHCTGTSPNMRNYHRNSDQSASISHSVTATPLPSHSVTATPLPSHSINAPPPIVQPWVCGSCQRQPHHPHPASADYANRRWGVTPSHQHHLARTYPPPPAPPHHQLEHQPMENSHHQVQSMDHQRPNTHQSSHHQRPDTRHQARHAHQPPLHSQLQCEVAFSSTGTAGGTWPYPMGGRPHYQEPLGALHTPRYSDYHHHHSTGPLTRSCSSYDQQMSSCMQHDHVMSCDPIATPPYSMLPPGHGPTHNSVWRPYSDSNRFTGFYLSDILSGPPGHSPHPHNLQLEPTPPTTRMGSFFVDRLLDDL